MSYEAFTAYKPKPETEERKPWIDVRVEKLALTMPQVREHSPPPNPAKLSDSRARAFIAKYGRQSWEVDALPPPVLRRLIVEAFEELLDLDLMETVKQREEEERERVSRALESVGL